MISFTQSAFKGGIRQDMDATKVAQLGDSYYLGINIRTSQDVLETIKQPLDMSNDLPAGKLQGIYGANTIIILFVAGQPYFKDFRYPETSFVRLTNFQMDDEVDYIYAEFVPGSTIGYARRSYPILNGEDVNSPIKTDNISFDRELPFNSSVQGIIYQDGISRPKLLTDDGNVRNLQDYASWNTANREYVPVGKFMHWSAGGKLYLISPDRSQVFHSVSGRPLDFVIPVTQEGDKDGPEVEGGAPATSIRMDYEPITGFRSTPAPNTYVATTLKRTFLVTELLGESDLIFDEPSFSIFPVAALGGVNHLSFAELNGDIGIINPNGIHSFNASQILQTESSSDPLSGPISGIFRLDEETVVAQDYPCAKEFGADYTLFAVNTVYGRGVLVYDRTISKFVSLDIYSGIAQIKQFADIIVDGIRRLFFITTDDKLYEAFAGEEVATAKITIGEWCSNDPRTEQSPLYLHAVFTECEEEGQVTVTPIINRVHYSPKSETLRALSSPKTLPISTPFGGGTINSTQVVTFNLSGTVSAGWKMGFEISWNVKAKLTHVSLSAEPRTQDVNSQTKARRYADGAS